MQTMSLLTNQKVAFDKLSELKIGALFMEMGTGKTKVMCDIIRSKRGKYDHVIWMCPFSLIEETRKEIAKWINDEIILVGYETISASDRVYLELLNMKNTFIVLDESIKIKNMDAIRTNRVIELSQNAKYRFILNGTPLTRNVLDVWSQMQFLSPKILNMSFKQFKNNYTEYYLRGRLKGLVKTQYNTEHLVSLIEPYIFDSKLEIESKKHYYRYYYDLVNIDTYQNIKEFYMKNYESTNTFSFYPMITELQKNYTSSDDRMAIIDQISKDKIVMIYVKYLSNIPEEEIKITGGESLQERSQILDEFRKGNIQRLWITYGCGSYGLNIQECKHIIFADHTFDYGQRIQAEARIYRYGQHDDVHYYDLVCSCGLEEFILNSQLKKIRLSNEIKKVIEKVGEVEWLKSI